MAIPGSVISPKSSIYNSPAIIDGNDVHNRCKVNNNNSLTDKGIGHKAAKIEIVLINENKKIRQPINGGGVTDANAMMAV